MIIRFRYFTVSFLFFLLFNYGCVNHSDTKRADCSFYNVSCIMRHCTPELDTVRINPGESIVHDSHDTLLYEFRFLIDNQLHEIRKYGGSRINHLESYVLFELDSIGVILKNHSSIAKYTYLVSSNDSLNRILEFARYRIAYYTELESRGNRSGFKRPKDLEKLMRCVW